MYVCTKFSTNRKVQRAEHQIYIFGKIFVKARVCDPPDPSRLRPPAKTAPPNTNICLTCINKNIRGGTRNEQRSTVSQLVGGAGTSAGGVGPSGTLAARGLPLADECSLPSERLTPLPAPSPGPRPIPMRQLHLPVAQPRDR